MSKRGRGRPPGTTHDEIRDIALRLFLDHGYDETSLAGIARAAGISRTTLFAYFRTKRDMIWEEYDLRSPDIDAALDNGEALPVVDMIVRALLVNARYTVDEHAALASRLRVVEANDELRAYAALAVQDITKRVAEGAARHAPEGERRLIVLVTRALVAAAYACVDEWAALDRPTTDLDAHVAAGIAPIVDALRTLLD